MEKDEPRSFPVQVYHLEEPERHPLIITPEGDILISPNRDVDNLKEGEVPLTRGSAQEVARQLRGIAFNYSEQTGFDYSDFVSALRLVSIPRNLKERNTSSRLLERVLAGTAFTQLEINLTSLKQVQIVKDKGVFGYVEKPQGESRRGLPVGTLRFAPNFGLDCLDLDEAELSANLYLSGIAPEEMPVFLRALDAYLVKNAMRLSLCTQDAEGRKIENPTTATLSYSTPWISLDGQYHSGVCVSRLKDYCIGSSGSPHYSLGEGLKPLPEMLSSFLDVYGTIESAEKKVQEAREQRETKKVQGMRDLIGV
jgi:hypothetical protein